MLIIMDSLADNVQEIQGLNKVSFKELSDIVTLKKYLLFYSGKLYKQIEWLAIGNPLHLPIFSCVITKKKIVLSM